MNDEQTKALLSGSENAVREVGRAFFAPDADPAENKAVLETLLREKRYDALCVLMHCGHITKQYARADFLSAERDGSLTLEARYLDLFLELAALFGIEDGDVMPMLFASAYAPASSCLRDWSGAVEQYLLKRAYEDYGTVADYLYACDKKFRFLPVLIRVDKARTVTELLHKALYGHRFDKSALRKFLRDYKSEAVAAVKAAYPGLKARGRECAVRLLLLFKNDAGVAEILDELKQNEKSVTVRRLIEADARAPERKDAAGGAEPFYRAMVSGAEWTAEQFTQGVLQNAAQAEIAAQLFFSVYQGGRMERIVIVDGGRLLDLDNNPTSLPDGCAVRVLHPVELSSKYDYLRRLNIPQPFEQIRRSVFVPDDADKKYNGCERLSGTLISSAQLKVNMKKYAFKALNRDIDGLCAQIGTVRAGVLCVLEVSPTDFHSPEEKLTTAGGVRFFSYADAIKLNGQIYVDGVPCIPPMNLSARAFSEFMHDAYGVLGCV